jgi:hypothetical protein
MYPVFLYTNHGSNLFINLLIYYYLFVCCGERQITAYKTTGSLGVLSSDFFLFFCKFGNKNRRFFEL